MINNIKYPFWGFIEKYKVFEISTKKEIIDRYKAAIDEYFEKNNLTLPNNKPLYEKERLPYALYLDLIDKEKCNVDLYTLIEIHKVRDAKLRGYDCTGSLEYFIQAHPELLATNEDPPTERAPTERGTLSLDKNLEFNPITGLTKERFSKFLEQSKKLIKKIGDPKIKTDYLLKNDENIEFLPTRNTSVVVAPKKNGKSSFVAILSASVLGCGKHWGFCETKRKRSVLLFDTEQDESDQQIFQDFVYRMCQENKMSKEEFDERFCTVHARDTRRGDLKELLESLIIYRKPDLVVLDGVAQMVVDPINQIEAAEINDQLQLLAAKYNCAILCVIHTTKKDRGNNDPSTFLSKGAIGTMLEQGASDIFVCVKQNWNKPKEEQYFEVFHESRHREMQSFKFKRDPQNDGMPCIYIPITDVKPLKIKNTIKQILLDNGNKPQTKGDLIKQVSDKLGKGFSEKMIQNFWKVDPTIIEDLYIDDKGNKTLVKLKSPNDPEQQVFNPIADPDQPTEEAPF